MRSIGLSARSALATPVTASVVTAGHTGVAVRGVRGYLLVAYVDHIDALVDATVVDVDDVAAAQREDDLDAFVLQRLRHQVPARDRGLAGFRVLPVRARLGVGDCLGHVSCHPLSSDDVAAEVALLAGRRPGTSAIAYRMM
jgi:hypothetical protein